MYSFQPLLQHARKAVRVSVRDHSDLEDWTSDDGPLVLIGEAAHPFPVSHCVVRRTLLGPNARSLSLAPSKLRPWR